MYVSVYRQINREIEIERERQREQREKERMGMRTTEKSPNFLGQHTERSKEEETFEQGLEE